MTRMAQIVRLPEATERLDFRCSWPSSLVQDPANTSVFGDRTIGIGWE